MGTIVNNKVLIVHGGISDTTDLDMIKSLDRGKVSFCFSCMADWNSELLQSNTEVITLGPDM